MDMKSMHPDVSKPIKTNDMHSVYSWIKQYQNLLSYQIYSHKYGLLHFKGGIYPQWSFNPKKLIFVVLYNVLIDYFIQCFEHQCTKPAQPLGELGDRLGRQPLRGATSRFGVRQIVESVKIIGSSIVHIQYK